MRLAGTPTVHLFAFGAAVVEVRALDRALLDRLRQATGAEPVPETEETWEVHGGVEEPAVGWDRISLPKVDERRLATIALLLAQSAALDR